MKKLLIVLIVYLLSTNVLIANESDCSGIKKLSKEYLVCKAKNIKESANSANKKIKEGSAKKTQQIKEGTKKIIAKVKSKIKKN